MKGKYTKEISKEISMKEISKRIAVIIAAVVFAAGTLCAPGAAIATGEAGSEPETVNGEAAGGTVEMDGRALTEGCEYVEGEVIVSYVDGDAVELTAGQEKKVEAMERSAETLMEVEDVPVSELPSVPDAVAEFEQGAAAAGEADGAVAASEAGEADGAVAASEAGGADGTVAASEAGAAGTEGTAEETTVD
mgnify:CR=1 FL=1